MNNDSISFYELIKDKKIVIPIIQRDYAQGRIANTDICKDFLNTIKEAIITDSPINLDFLYGNVEGDVFNPLDGQQRLTTLFLLHWYAFEKEKSDNQEIRNTLIRFSYETRISSRRFCEALVSNNISICEEKQLSLEIKDSEWFFMSWEADSSIKAMLHAIDLIHSTFFEVNNLWEALVDKKLVTFHLLFLEDFGLSDDLYIKMNARGKLLSPFENLKAELEDKALKGGWEVDQSAGYGFSNKIDGEWTDFIWKNFRKANSVDEPHMNFITTLVMFQVALDSKYKGDERNKIIQTLNENNSDRNLINYIDRKTFYYIYNCYELYSTAVTENSIPELSLELWNHTPEKNILNQVLVGTQTSYTQRVLFFAQTEYLLNNENVNPEKFNDWMRVVRNVVARGNITKEGKRPDIIRSPEAFNGVINLIHELSAGCSDIYKFLSSHSVNSAFAREQIREETLKAEIIVSNTEYKQLIFDTEDNELLRGQITFALECAGYKSNINDIDFSMLADVMNVFKKYFNKELNTNDEEFDLLRRAMLTIENNGEYCFYNYWWSFWYAGDAEKRRLFAGFREIEYFIGDKEFNGYFKKLVNLLISRSYQDIIDDFVKPDAMKNWQYRLIKKGELLKNCPPKYIAISKDGERCYLLKSKRPSRIEDSVVVQ